MPGLVVHARDPSALKDELEVGLRMLGEAVAIPAAERGPIRPTFNVLRRGVCDIAVLDRTWQTWEQALEAVGTALQSFRNRREPDYNNVKGVVGGRSPRLQTVERAAFGLPIVFYFRSLGGASGTLQGDKSDRRASPLWIRVVRLTAGGYAVVLTVFRAPLLQDREPLKLKTRGRPALAPAPGLALIDDFLRALSTPGGLHYVAPLLEVGYP
ncbi:MAG: hypothetical protein QME70_00905 [Bacillota bacterium]|nr:hypothetical protein [Bacillota bacterium]